MVTTYRVLGWRFNTELLSSILSAYDDNFLEFLEGALEVDIKTLRGWRDNLKEREFPHPNMSNFLKLVNMLDLDAREFFVLED